MRLFGFDIARAENVITSADLAQMLQGYATESGVNVTPSSALFETATFRCVSLISNAIAMLPLVIMQDREVAKEHPLYILFKNKPNDYQSTFIFKQNMQVNLLKYGKAYAKIVRGVGNRVVALLPIRPDRVTVEVSDAGKLVYTVNTNTNGIVNYTSDEIFSLIDLTEDGYTAIGRVDRAREAIGLSKKAEQATAEVMKAGKGEGFILHPRQLNDKQYARLADSLTGYRILEDGMNANQSGRSARDNQHLEQRKFQLEEIARVFGIPRPLLMVDETSWGCLPEYTPVQTLGGFKKIKDIEIGDEVWSYKKDEGVVKAKVTNKMMTGKKPCLTIRTTSKEIEVTENHVIPVRRYFGKKDVGNKGCGWRDIELKASEIKVGDYLLTPLDFAEEGIKETPTGRSITTALMEFCGLYTADGSHDGRSFGIARDKDASYMDAYRKNILALFTSSSTDRKDIKQVVLQEGERYTRVTSKSACEEIDALGLTGVAHTKRVPSWVFKCSKEHILSYLRGYLDGDGTVNTRGWITWSSCNKDLLEDIRVLCMLVGVHSGTIRATKFNAERKNYINGRLVKGGQQYQLFSFAVESNKQIGAHDVRYMERWEGCPPSKVVCSWSEHFKGRGSGVRSVTSIPVPTKTRLEKVRCITLGSELKPVYDLEVEGTEHYIANGLVVHNSGLTALGLFFIQYCLQPFFSTWESSINSQLLGTDFNEGYFAKYNEKALLRGTTMEQGAYFASALGSGGGKPWMDVDEVREIMDLPKNEKLNEVTQNANQQHA